MKLFFVFVLLGAVYALLTRCQITTNGVFFKRVTDQDVEEEVMLADQSKLSSEFFMCGRTQSCSNFVKNKDTKEHQTVNGKEELKKVNRAVVTWEKVMKDDMGDENQTPKNEDEWTVIQRRIDNSTDFYRNWTKYKTGFGNKAGNWWIGLNKIHAMAGPGKGTMLNITLKSGKDGDELFYAQYSHFEVKNEVDNYQLTVAGYSGNAGNSLQYHSLMNFSTFDRDNDKWNLNCAKRFKGGWWHNSCIKCNLNSWYPLIPVSPKTDGRYMSWQTLHDFRGDITFSEMQVKIKK